MDAPRTTRTLFRFLFFAFGAAVLVSQLGCLSASSPSTVANLRYTVEARSTSGELLGSTQFLIETGYPYISDIRRPERTDRTDSEGRLEVSEIRYRDPSNAFKLRARVPWWMRLRFKFPEVHPLAEYDLNVILDQMHPCWDFVEEDLKQGPPPKGEASSKPKGKSCLDREFARTNDYYSTTLLADGVDTRSVPFRWSPPIGGEPGEPRLEVRVKATPLVGERGHRLYIWVVAPDPFDREVERAELLRTLRGYRERMKTGQANDRSDLKRQNLQWLWGMSRKEFRETLGEPDYCVVSYYRPPGTYGEFTHPEVPCDHKNADYVYRFYHDRALREPKQELRLVIGDEGTCVMSQWVTASDP